MTRIINAPVVRPVTSDDGNLVQQLYLKMFSDSPNAFGETMETVHARTFEYWQEFVNLCAVGTNLAAFVAEDILATCGFVRVELGDPRTPVGTALVSELWVSPNRRGSGLGRELMNRATEWAKTHKASRISLGVAETNLAVLSFYEKLGYKDTGLRVPLPSNHQSQVVVLAKVLSNHD